MAHIRKVGGKWCMLEGSKAKALPPDIAETLENGTFKLSDYVQPTGQPLSTSLTPKNKKS